MWFIFFDILWLIICDIGYALILNDYLWCNYSLVLNFILKNIYIYIYCFFIKIKYDKQVDITDPINKWVVLGLRNLDPFNKYVKLVLTYSRILMSWHGTNPTRKRELPPLGNTCHWQAFSYLFDLLSKQTQFTMKSKHQKKINPWNANHLQILTSKLP